MKSLRELIDIIEGKKVSNLPVEYGRFIIYPILNRTFNTKTHKMAFGDKAYASTKKVNIPNGYQIVFKQDGKDYYVNPKFATASDNPIAMTNVYDGSVEDAKLAIDKMVEKVESGELKFEYRK